MFSKYFRPITLFVCCVGLLHAQSAAVRSFEVASIKPAPPITREMAMAGQMHTGVKVTGEHLDIGYTSLAELIRMAYEVKPYQVSGPSWMAFDKWDILANLPEGSSSHDIPRLLQAFLAERFQLTAHKETAELNVYVLEPGTGGATLKEAPVEDAATPESESNAAAKPVRVESSNDGGSHVVRGAGYGVTRTQMQPDGSMHLESSAMTIPMLINVLAAYLDKPVIDRTNLTGKYQVALDLSAADLRAAAMKAGAIMPPRQASGGESADAAEPGGVSLLASVRSLGLKLQVRKLPVEIVVVDHLEKSPTAN